MFELLEDTTKFRGGITYNVRGFVSVGELTNCPPGTEAKLIIKS